MSGLLGRVVPATACVNGSEGSPLDREPAHGAVPGARDAEAVRDREQHAELAVPVLESVPRDVVLRPNVAAVAHWPDARQAHQGALHLKLLLCRGVFLLF